MRLKLTSPVKRFRINQRFGENNNGYYAQLGLKGHNGLDLYAQDGDPIYASHDGIVTFSGEDGAGGLTIVIRTLEEFEYDGGKAYLKTIYCHMQKGSLKVKATEKVKAGQIIGLADNTGLSTGSHLHFGLKPIQKGEADWQWDNIESKNGYFGAIDPEPYLPKSKVKTNFQFSKTMNFGQKNEEVTKLQVYLRELGYLDHIATGFYGALTKDAVLKFQLDYKIISNPIESGYGFYCGKKTLSVLNSI